LTKLYETIEVLHARRIIHVLGSCGGGRDVSRRPVLGRMAAAKADVVIVTNEDPYDDDPRTIIDQVAQGARKAGKQDGQDLFLIIDRQAAIDKAMELARPNDLVLLTGKGSEQKICVAWGKKMPWDEREAARKAIRRAIAQSAVKA
jgi:UDP-N-acetylmuramoyl-L-alanyl-D-glutamate--2,6-diaminopimelate ligase